MMKNNNNKNKTHTYILTTMKMKQTRITAGATTVAPLISKHNNNNNKQKPPPSLSLSIHSFHLFYPPLTTNFCIRSLYTKKAGRKRNKVKKNKNEIFIQKQSELKDVINSDESKIYWNQCVSFKLNLIKSHRLAFDRETITSKSFFPILMAFTFGSDFDLDWIGLTTNYCIHLP